MTTKASKGYYSLIQYCPDLGRLEAANIGVLLFCPERHFLKARTSPNNSRIIHFFGSDGHDWARINSFKKGLEDRIEVESSEIKNLEDLQRFADLRANLLQITPPRPMAVTDPEKDLDEIFRDLIGKRVHRKSSKSLRNFLAVKLTTAGLERKLRKDLKVSVPVLQREVEIPFGFQNGRFNLINPVRFEAANPEQSVATACKYAVEGRSLYDAPDPQLGALQLVIVGKFRPKDQNAQDRVKRVFDDHGVKLYTTKKLEQLIDEIRQTGKDVEVGENS